ncbi:MAG: methionyl-tRNA formyltransferase [Phycisphaerales bacterium]|nr:methionyl-tRNA formyltransferase [Phycisphaerales bacterium]
MSRERLVLLGSGSFGIPAFEQLLESFDCRLVVSQPDRAAGRGQSSTPTPVSKWALSRGLPLLRTADVNAPEAVAAVAEHDPAALAVVAFGQKLGAALLGGHFAINLHGSLLPRWRGAAPVQRALMSGDGEVGVCVIAVADRMDAGAVFAGRTTKALEAETAGELHDRLSLLGAPLLLEVLQRHFCGGCAGISQDESLVTRAKKLSRSEAWVNFGESARMVAARINGLNPWPGCDGEIAGHPLRLLRAKMRVQMDADPAVFAGNIGIDGGVRCGGGGVVDLLEVQAAGGRPMDLGAFLRGKRVVLPCSIKSGVTTL